MRRCFQIVGVMSVVALCLGCGGGDKPKYPTNNNSKYDYNQQVYFLDDAETNSSLEVELQDLAFVDKEGQETRIRDLTGDKNLVVVVTRGYAGQVCPFCSTQVSRLIEQYETLKKLNAEVIAVFPVETNGDAAKLDEFLLSVKDQLTNSGASDQIPFPVLLDVELNGVDQLGIRKDLSKPATYIVDVNGEVRYAYVGKSMSDRPSVAAIVKQLEKLQPATPQN